MKHLLLPLLAALVLPIAVNAESYNARLARQQWKTIQKLQNNAQKFAGMRDYKAACRWESKANGLIEMNFEGLQEIFPSLDMFAYRKASLNAERAMCNAARLSN